MRRAWRYLEDQLRGIVRDARRRWRRRRLGIGHYQTTAFVSPERILDEADCVFVASTGRCGTALLTQLLELDVRNDVWHDPDTELNYPSTLAYRNFADHETQLAEIALHARFDMIAEAVLRGLRYIETNNRITFYLPGLLRLLPRARVVHLVRHPEAFIASGVRRGYYQGTLGDLGHIVPRDGSPEAAQWPHWSPVVRCAWLWNETNAWIEKVTAELPPNRRTMLRAEDLFHEPQVVAELLRFCDTQVPAGRIRRKMRRPVNAQRGSFPPFAEWDREDQRLVCELTPLRRNYGYTFEGGSA